MPKCLYEHNFLKIFSNKNLGIELLGHLLVSIYLLNTANLFPEWLQYFTPPTSNVWEAWILPTLTSTWYS